MTQPRPFLLATVLTWAIFGLTSSAWAAAASTPQPQEPTFQQGQNYYLVVPAQPTRVQRDQVEVLDFFSYDCSRCYALEPYLKHWVSTQADSIVFTRVPLLFTHAQTVAAQAFYTAQALGQSNAFKNALFDFAHNQSGSIDRDAFAQFFAQKGVSNSAFMQAWQSPQVKQGMTRAGMLSTRYRVRSAPVIVIGGSYATRPKMTKNADQFFTILNALIDKKLAQKVP